MAEIGARVKIWVECEISCGKLLAHLPNWFHLGLDMHILSCGKAA